MEGGLRKSIEILEALKLSSPTSSENTNRVIFITDGVPNCGSDEKNML